MAIPGCWVPWWSNPSELRVGGPPHTFLQVQGCGCGGEPRWATCSLVGTGHCPLSSCLLPSLHSGSPLTGTHLFTTFHPLYVSCVRKR